MAQQWSPLKAAHRHIVYLYTQQHPSVVPALMPSLLDDVNNNIDFFLFSTHFEVF